MNAPDVVVVLGTDHHPYDRAVQWADRWARSNPGRSVFVQYGYSSAPQHADGAEILTPMQLSERMAAASVVITHGGPGTISAARAAHHRPIVIARNPRHGEHVDDHQMRFSRWAHERDLVEVCEDLDALGEMIAAEGYSTRLSVEDESGAGLHEGARASVERFDASIARHRARGRGRAVSVTGPTILFIGGFGRSGSTLVERVIDSTPQAVSLGEVVHLWRRGVIEDELCSCGEPFSKCAFWTEVGDRAFGGWAGVDVERVTALHDAVDRQRRFLRTLRPTSVRARDEILQYTAYYRAVYRAAAEVAGADIVVDSSKHASLALALSNDREIDLRVLHLVRDSVAVAHSWSKEVQRPETRERGETMVRYSSARASALWMSNNVLVQAARLVRTPVDRVRYEDFVRDPLGTLRETWRVLSLPGGFDLDISPGTGIELPRGHSIGGNPMRFKEGPVIIRSDEAWREAMPRRQRRLVSLLTAPVRIWLGYTN